MLKNLPIILPELPKIFSHHSYFILIASLIIPFYFIVPMIIPYGAKFDGEKLILTNLTNFQ